MEESQKRRERLKAMRIEAADATVDADTDRSGLASAGLSNPFVEGERTSIPTQYFSPRFDYYTDPMAAFSGSRRDNITPQVSHGHYNMLPRPTYQSMTPDPSYGPPGVNPSEQRIFQVPGAHFNQSPLARPMELAGRPQGNLPNAWGGPGGPFNYKSLPNMSRGGHFSNPSELAGRPHGNPPNARGGPGSALNYARPSNMSRGSHFSNLSFGQEDYPRYGRGRGQNYYSSSHASGCGGSRHPESGRGRGRSPGSRMSGGRGGSHESVSAEVRPDLYCRKEMVEDPWKMLTPVNWKDTHAPDTDKSWLPKSITMKKAKVSTEGPHTSTSQQSLAQYLATSFSDSTDEPVHNEPST